MANGSGEEKQEASPEMRESPPRMMMRILSTLFWAFLVTSCVVLFFGALLIFLVTFPFDRNGRVLHLYSCAWAQLYFWVNPMWECRVEGRENLPWRGGAVIVANHESLGDILVLFGLYRPFKWVSKQSVFNVPFLGWNMRLNRYVPLVRGKRESVVKMLEDCKRWIARGVPVLMFPEGTRSDDGTVKAFKDGAFQIALETGAPIIPIALTGTARSLPKHGYVLREKVICRVKVLPPVDTKPFAGQVDALREHVRQLIIDERKRIEAAIARG